MMNKRPRKKASQAVNVTADPNIECVNPKMCRGKHKRMEPNETFLKNAEKLFENLQIKIINTPGECREVVGELRRHSFAYNVLGFDCEWISQYRRYPVALLQLSTSQGLCALFRLCKLQTIPKELQELLEDETVLKVGIQPFGDAKNLVKDYGIACVASTLDLRPLAKECGLRSGGLGQLAEEHLQVQLNKNRCISASDWQSDTLAQYQIDYAARDAHVAIELFKTFAEKLKPKPIDGDGKQHVQQFIDEYCVKYLNVKGNPNKTPVERVDYFKNQQIYEIRDANECRDAIKVLKSHCDEYNVLGFKLLKTNDRSPAYLLQLTTHRRMSVIVRLRSDTVTAELKEMLEDKRILKVGVRPAMNLPNNWCRVVGTLDLNYLLCQHRKDRFALPLPALSQWFLKVKLKKNPSMKLKKVEENLSKNDAHIAIELFKEFMKKLQPEPGPGNDKRELDLEEFIDRHCRNYLDIKFDKSKVVTTDDMKNEGGK